VQLSRATANHKPDPVPSPFRSQAAAYVLLPLACACWAGNHVIARAAGGHVPPASLGVARWALVAVLVLPFALVHARADWPELRRSWRVTVFLAVTGGALFGTLQFVALHFTTALNMGLVGSISPAFIVAASWMLFRDRLSFVQLIGVTISLSGVVVIVSRLDLERLTSFSFNGGDLIIIANMVFWAVYCACLRLRPAMHPMTFMLAFALIAGVSNLPFAALEYAFDYRLQPTWLTIVSVLYAAVVTTLLAYFAWNRGIDIVGAPRASAFLHTLPVFSVILATSILGEKVEPYHLVGFLLILGGVSLAARPTAQQRIAAQEEAAG
jgi:drug/metabolite transporter (DMT)-like permease